VNVRRGGVAAGAVIAVLAGAAWVIVRRDRKMAARVGGIDGRLAAQERSLLAAFEHAGIPAPGTALRLVGDAPAVSRRWPASRSRHPRSSGMPA
jgi:hypothetical protein